MRQAVNGAEEELVTLQKKKKKYSLYIFQIPQWNPSKLLGHLIQRFFCWQMILDI